MHRVVQRSGKVWRWRSARAACAALLLIATAACGTERGASTSSYFAQTYGGGVLSVTEMRPTALVPPMVLDHGPECPANLRTITVVPGADSALLRYLSQLVGPPDSESGPTYVNATHFKRAFRLIAEQLERASAQTDAVEPAMALVKRYPLRNVPGNVGVIHAIFYTVPDPHFTLARFEREARPGDVVAGVMLEVRATFQFDAHPPRLIEAVVEVSPEVRRVGHRRSLARVASGLPIPLALAGDALYGGHFYPYGGGRRLGFYWCDQALGRESAKPWSCAYQIQTTGGSSWDDVETEALDELDLGWLLKIARTL